MIKSGSQNDEILSYLRSRGSITTMEAFAFLGITRLSGRIFELKKQGICIETKMVMVPTRSGKMAEVAQYSLC